MTAQIIEGLFVVFVLFVALGLSRAFTKLLDKE